MTYYTYLFEPDCHERYMLPEMDKIYNLIAYCRSHDYESVCNKVIRRFHKNKQRSCC